jgi:cell wall-associated NlpC family hydrolase
MIIQQRPFRVLAHISALFAASCLCMPSLAWEAGAPDSHAASTTFHDSTDRTSELAMRAMALVGVQYRYGGNSPEDGMDCSGLVGYVFKETWGMDLPRTSEEISRIGKKVERHELLPGDLVFYNTLKRAFSHVGIYLGDNKFVHSPSAGGQVRIERMDVNYWEKRFNGARRISDPPWTKAAIRQ